ncbi:hypothetical protein AKJ16_DCAP05725 [Drosera capensis]
MLVVNALLTGALTVDDRPPSARSISADDRTVHFAGGVVILSYSDHRLPRSLAASGNIMVNWTTLACHICGYQTMAGPGGILLLLVCLESPRPYISSRPFTICVETYYMQMVDLCILALLLKTLLESPPSAPGDSNTELVIWVEFQSGVNFHGRVKITKDRCIINRYVL